MLINYRMSAWVTLVAILAGAPGCGTKKFENRFDRKMKVLQHQQEKNAALGESWADADWEDEDGDLIRTSTGVRYRLPKLFRLKMDQNQWPDFPACVPAQDVLAVYVGAEGANDPLVYCYILAEKADDSKSAETPEGTPSQGEEGPKTLALHARVREAWEQAYGNFEVTQVTQPRGNEFGPNEYGPQRRFDALHHVAEGEDPVHLYLFPSSIDASTTHQVAVYIYIQQGAPNQDTLVSAAEMSLETISFAAAVPVSSDAAGAVIP